MLGEGQRLRLRPPGWSGLLAGQGDGDPGIRIDAEVQRVDDAFACFEDEHIAHGRPEPDVDLSRLDWQALAGPDEDRNACPAPGIQAEPYGHERLDSRLRVDPCHVA